MLKISSKLILTALLIIIGLII